MSTNPYYTQGYPPCSVSDEQGDWVFIPRAPTTTSFTVPNLPNASHGFYLDCPSTSNMNMATDPTASLPTMMWDELPADPAFPPMPLDLQASFDEYALAMLEMSTTGSHFPGLDSEIALSPLPSAAPLGTGFQHSADSVVYGAFTGDVYPLGGSCASGSSDGYQTTVTTPATTMSPCSTPPTPTTLLCSADPNCFATFAKPADLKKHERKHKQQSRFCCILCGKAHSDRRALDRHLWSKHKEHALRSGARSETIRCRMCDYESRADNVRRHEKSQHSSADRAAGCSSSASRR